MQASARRGIGLVMCALVMLVVVLTVSGVIAFRIEFELDQDDEWIMFLIFGAITTPLALLLFTVGRGLSYSSALPIRAKILILSASAADVGALCMLVYVAVTIGDPLRAIIIPLLMTVANVLFILYLKQLARIADRPDVVHTANEVLVYLAVAGVVAGGMEPIARLASDLIISSALFVLILVGLIMLTKYFFLLGNARDMLRNDN